VELFLYRMNAHNDLAVALFKNGDWHESIVEKHVRDSNYTSEEGCYCVGLAVGFDAQQCCRIDSLSPFEIQAD
jgi:hypothetical protein